MAAFHPLAATLAAARASRSPGAWSRRSPGCWRRRWLGAAPPLAPLAGHPGPSWWHALNLLLGFVSCHQLAIDCLAAPAGATGTQIVLFAASF
jgi:hypothetical protein